MAFCEPFQSTGGTPILTPKTHLRICVNCVMCPTCYDRVKEETEQMQEKIQSELGLEPVDKEVVALYDCKRDEQPVEFREGKRIFESEKCSPVCFSKNLLQRSTQPATTDNAEVICPEIDKLG